MRLLHTSDWHLGQSLHNFERGYEHQRFLDWLLDTIVAEQADALLIAGDVFDNANPSSAAQRQLYRFLQQAKARAPQLDLIVIAGNHDSPGRLEAPGPLLEAHGTQVIGSVPRSADGQIDVERLVLPLTGKSGQVEAWCLAIPFLRPGDVPRQPEAQPDGQQQEQQQTQAQEQEQQQTLQSTPEEPHAGADPYLAGIALLYRQAYAVAQARRQPGQSIVAMGHCHMVDGQMSNDSERRIVIGGTEMLPAGIFDPLIAYAALGHLHLAQTVGKQERIRYCGSPIPLSFAETGYRHQILRVDLDPASSHCAVLAIPVPRAVELLRVPAKPAPLEQVLEQLEQLAVPLADADAALPPEAWPFLEVRVLLDAPQPGMRARVEAALAGKQVRLAKIDTTTPGRAPSLDEAERTLDQLDKLQPDDIFQRLYLQRFGNAAPADQLSAFAELMLPGA